MGKVTTSVVIDEQIQEYFQHEAINFSQFVRDAARQRMIHGPEFNVRDFRLQQVERRLEELDREREELAEEAEQLREEVEQQEQFVETVGSFADEIKTTSQEFSHYAPSQLRSVKPFQDRATEYGMTVSELIERVVEYRQVVDGE
jgi:methyl-accepting chemotaxis protein